MPRRNQFRHQSYPTSPTVRPVFRTLSVSDGEGVDFSQVHTRLGFGHVILVHGTFMGDDSFAIAETLRSIASESSILHKPLETLADKLQAKGKPIADQLAGDIGNYTDQFREDLQSLVGPEPVVERMEPPWSGQNHHLARADLAVRLVCILDDLRPHENNRVMLWGHSHAGNGFAILSNLLANDAFAVEQFFLRSGYRAEPHWKRASDILKKCRGPHPMSRFVSIVAFGTPVRYGWDVEGYASLTHVLHHRNYDVDSPYRAHPLFPPQSFSDVTGARYGDWIQTFGIAGTDVVPPTLRDVDRKIGTLLESGLEDAVHELDTRFIPIERVRNACARWKQGTRCHTDGHNLLVNYNPSGRSARLIIPLEEVLLGHGVATARIWLPCHLNLVMQSMLTNPFQQ